MKLRNRRTGVIVECENIVFAHCNAFALDWEQYTPNVNSLAELNEEWEDYNPKEPLIKNEKIREAVRAWAEANDIGVVRVAPFAVFDIETSARIYFYGRVIEDKDYNEKKSCTIAELCGEEEE